MLTRRYRASIYLHAALTTCRIGRRFRGTLVSEVPVTPELPNNPADGDELIFSVGHSNHDIARFLQLLTDHQIEVVADVRTSPFSRYSPHFNREPLSKVLREAGIGYVFLGKELGGRPDGTEYYDIEGHVRYDRLSLSELFNNGIERLVQGANDHRVAMVCSEGDPAQCHRHLLIARVLHERGVRVVHIESDGSTSSYESVAERTPVQRSLFDGEEEGQWRSPLSVLHSTAQSPSSAD